MILLDLRSSTHLADDCTVLQAAEAAITKRFGVNLRPVPSPRPYAAVLFVVAAIVAVTVWGWWG